MGIQLNLNGFLVINKPKGWTSFDVVAKVRGLLRVKKVGHTGTLDPMATGVLVLCVGKATKKAEDIVKKEKEYEGTVTLGATSTTDDADGEVTPVPKTKKPTLASITTALKKFTGTFEQMPPQYSAKKVNGKRAYRLARAGKSANLKPVEVTVHSLELLDYKYPNLKIRVTCGKGFYMRSLARDLGTALGTGAYLSALTRTRVGQYSISQAIEVEEAEANKISGL